MWLFCFPAIGLLPYLMWGWIAGRREDGGSSQPSPCSLGNRPVCVCLLQLKCHEAASPFDPALMSPQSVSLSGNWAPLHIPLIGKKKRD